MHRRFSLGSGLVLVFFALAPVTAGEPSGSPAVAKPIPSAAEVQQTVWRYFQGRRDFQSGDLITSDSVAPLLEELQRQGLPLADADEILEAVLGKGDFLVRQFGGRPAKSSCAHFRVSERLRPAGSARRLAPRRANRP